MMPLWKAIAETISTASGRPFHYTAQQTVAGGCINNAYTIADAERQYFVKINSAELAEMFEAEAAGLNEIAASNSIKVPKVICSGIAAGKSYLVLEQLVLGRGDNPRQLGHDLAQMHRNTKPDYGWYRDNTIGSTPQLNKRTNSWIDFWREQRLGFQLQLAQQKGLRGKLQQLGTILLENLEAIFDSHQPAASLLHGDLWSGNVAFTSAEVPVIFDPAVYYGDRETDIAMTELFGGFSPEFYRTYEEEYPLSPGYSQRKTLYNLYHILNHANLFGGGYVQQAESMMHQLLAEM